MSKKEIVICQGKHCIKKSKNIIENLKSEDVKIRMAKCLDMCDYAQVAYLKEERSVYLKAVHRYDEKQWQKLLKSIKDGESIKKLDFVKTA